MLIIFKIFKQRNKFKNEKHAQKIKKKNKDS